MSVVFFAIRVISSCDSIQAADASIDARSHGGRPNGSAGECPWRAAPPYRNTFRAGQALLLASRVGGYPPTAACVKPNRSDIYAAFKCRQNQGCAVAAPQFRLTGLMRNAVRDVEYSGRDRLRLQKVDLRGFAQRRWSSPLGQV